MRRVRVLLALPLAVVLLAGCGEDPADALRADVAAVTEAANARDAAGVRTQVDALLATVEAQREREQITSEEAEQLVALARAVRSGADVIDEDLLERRRAEAEAEAAKKQLEEERRKAAEEAAKKAEEERKKAEEERKKDEEERKKDEGKDEDKDD